MSDELVTGSESAVSTPSPAPSGDLSAAVESITTAAPKLTGFDRLNDKISAFEKSTTPKGVDKKTTAGRDGVGPVEIPKPEAPKPVDPNAPTAVFTPDFKYKAGGKEHEIPEKFRALITDKETEEEVKKIFGQAATLPEVKAEVGSLKENLNKVGGVVNQYQSGVQHIRSLYAKGDIDGWLKSMNVPQEKIYEWVLNKVQYNQLPPEERAKIDSQRDLQNKSITAEENLSRASQRELDLALQLKGMQLNQTLEKADVKSINDTFDTRVGKPGAFKEAVIEYAGSVWANTRVDLTPEQAVQQFIQKFGITPGNAAAVAATTQPGGSPAVVTKEQPKVNVIPNVAGRSTSPMKKSYRSVEDLKKRSAEVNVPGASSQGYLAG